MCDCFGDNTYIMIGAGVGKFIFLLFMLITLIKPLAVKFYNWIGYPLDYTRKYADVAIQEMGKVIFFSDKSAATKAGVWILYLILSGLMAFLGGILITLLWPLGIVFLIAFMVFNKKKKD